MSEAQRLINAANFGNLAGVEAALAAGADVNVRDTLALQVAARNGSVVVVDRLIDAGADVHASRNIALFWAALNRNPAVVARLFDAGADIHAMASHMDPRLARDVETAEWLRDIHRRWQAKQAGQAIDTFADVEVDRVNHEGLGL